MASGGKMKILDIIAPQAVQVGKWWALSFDGTISQARFPSEAEAHKAYHDWFVTRRRK